MSRKTWSYVIVSVALAGTLQACGGGSGGGTVGATDTTRLCTDTTPPTITAFTLPATAASLTVSVSAFTATDNVAVTGYMVTQSATPPAASAAGWTATAPATVTAAGTGSQTFFPWAKDAAGNVSAVGTPATVNIAVTATIPDTTAPAVTAFTLPASAASLSVSVSAFTATDNVAVTGYMVTQSATPPAASAAGWTATAPATVTAAAAGSQTFFPWAKDAAGNVSAVGTPATVTITLPPPSERCRLRIGNRYDIRCGGRRDLYLCCLAGDYHCTTSPGSEQGTSWCSHVFAGAPNALTIVNPSPTDGIVTVSVNTECWGKIRHYRGVEWSYRCPGSADR